MRRAPASIAALIEVNAPVTARSRLRSLGDVVRLMRQTFGCYLYGADGGEPRFMPIVCGSVSEAVQAAWTMMDADSNVERIELRPVIGAAIEVRRTTR
jgi:hypothetical protein